MASYEKCCNLVLQEDEMQLNNGDSQVVKCHCNVVPILSVHLSRMIRIKAKDMILHVNGINFTLHASQRQWITN